MLKKISLSLSTSLICLLAHAQSEMLPPPQDLDPVRPKWEVALNVLPVIRNIQAGEAGLMVRKHFTDDKGRAKAYRLTVSNFNQNLIKGTDWTFKPSHFNSFNLALGQEWQRQTGKFTFYYGGEIGTGIDWFLDTNLGDTGVIDGMDYEYGRASTLFYYGMVNGFIGGKYNINPHLSLSLESSIFYRQGKQERYGKYYDSNKDLIHTQEVFFENTYELRIRPLASVYVSYYFN